MGKLSFINYIYPFITSVEIVHSFISSDIYFRGTEKLGGQIDHSNFKTEREVFIHFSKLNSWLPFYSDWIIIKNHKKSTNLMGKTLKFPKFLQRLLEERKPRFLIVFSLMVFWPSIKPWDYIVVYFCKLTVINCHYFHTEFLNAPWWLSCG